MRSAEPIDQRLLRTAKGAAIPPQTQRHMRADPIPERGGNSHVHDHHLWTREDHLAREQPDELDTAKRPWTILLYTTLGLMLVLWLMMIARG